MAEPLLTVRELVTTFDTERGPICAVDRVSFEVFPGKTLGLVGESGCGKSVTSLSILRLVPTPPGRIEGGNVRFGGKNLLDLPERRMRELRGNRISMIFQEPMTSLNPVYRVGAQIVEAIRLHEDVSRRTARERTLALLKRVGIPASETNIDAYPHQLSGGMRQRVMIAMALACKPDVLIADEPTTALDVTIQAQILDLISELQSDLKMGVLLITHDLGVVKEQADHVIVMYAGQVVESATAEDLFREPAHPYTRGLIASLPTLDLESIPDSDLDSARAPRRLMTIPGVVPDLARLPEGCRFADRCPHADERCKSEAPELREFDGERSARCHYFEQWMGGGA